MTAMVAEPGEIAISAVRLAALVSGFAAGAPVTITTTETAAIIVCGNSRSRLPIIPDLPAGLAFADEIGRVEVAGVDCLTLLEPLCAVATEETRFYLTGVFWHTVGDRLTAIGTDGARLYRTSIPAGEFSATRDLIVPCSAGVILQRLIARTKPAKVTLRRSRTLFAVSAPAFEFCGRLIDSKYPDCERVIPAASSNVVSVARSELLASLSRLAAVAFTEPTPLVALAWSDALNIFLARQPDDGADAITAAECAGVAKVAIPLSQFTAMLAELKGERVRLEAAEGKPLVITSEGEKLMLITQSAWQF
jgi:DNA polymerase-3 subunit beta